MTPAALYLIAFIHCSTRHAMKLQYATHLTSSNNPEDLMIDILVEIQADFMDYTISVHKAAVASNNELSVRAIN